MADSDSVALSIPSLTIAGIPTWGRPDLVYREKGTTRMIIVEVKTSEADIPSDGWPNMRAQLWAYFKIHSWRDIDDILLVGEVWGFKNGLRLRQSIRWHNSDQNS